MKNQLTLVLVLFASLYLSGCVTGVARDINGEEDRMRLGQQAFDKRDFDRAKEHYLVAVKESPNNSQALFKLGNIALYQGRNDDAANYYQRVLDIDPQFTRAHYNLAVIHLQRAEDHFSYYTATLDSGQPVDNNLIRLLSDIDAFATEKESPDAAPADPLDSLGELLGPARTSP